MRHLLCSLAILYYVIAQLQRAHSDFSKCTLFKGSIGQFLCSKQTLIEGVAFMIIGCLVSTARICLYIWKMFCINDCFSADKDLVGRYNQYSVCVDAIKVIMEVFPQSIIAEFAFAGCPIKTSNWKFLDIGFDVFCIAQYVIFICSVSFWYMCCKECKIEKGIFTFFLTALATTFSKPGSAMAIISFSKSVKCP